MDLTKEEERLQKIAAIQAKRQRVIDEVQASLRRRRMEKIAIQNARFDKEARLRQKQIRDAAKTGSDKEMLQVFLTTMQFRLPLIKQKNLENKNRNEPNSSTNLLDTNSSYFPSL